MSARQTAILWGILFGFLIMYAYRMYRIKRTP